MSYGDYGGPRSRPREPWPNNRYKPPRNLTRWRVLAFCVALWIVALSGIASPWNLGLGIIAYLVLVFPALPRTNDRTGGRT